MVANPYQTLSIQPAEVGGELPTEACTETGSCHFKPWTHLYSFRIIPPFILIHPFSVITYPYLEPIPAGIGRVVGYTHKTSSVHHRTQPFTPEMQKQTLCCMFSYIPFNFSPYQSRRSELTELLVTPHVSFSQQLWSMGAVPMETSPSTNELITLILYVNNKSLNATPPPRGKHCSYLCFPPAEGFTLLTRGGEITCQPQSRDD